MTQLQLVLQKVLDAVIVMRCNGTVADWNGCAEATFGWKRAEALDRSMNDLIVPPRHREAHARGLQRYLETGDVRVLDRRIEITALDKAGREFPIELTITEAEYLGEKVFIGFLRDISERKAAELALRESEVRLAATYNHAFVGIGEVDRDGRFLRVNEQFCRITGYDQDELRKTTIFSISHPEDVPEDKDLFQKQWGGELDKYTVEKRYIRKDGEIVWVEVAASIVRGEEGASSFGVRIVRDVTHRKLAEQHQHLLLSELNHRVKNMLSVVQGLALQTFRGETVPPEIIGTFQQRLTALAKAHALLVEQSWTATPIRRVIEEALGPFDLENRFEVAGDELLLNPQTAVTFALAFHELATNASKYGALSTPRGRVVITWSTRDDVFDLSWQETGGPPVSKPLRGGFGTRLLEKGLARELGGKVQLDYAPEGLICRVTAPTPSFSE